MCVQGIGGENGTQHRKMHTDLASAHAATCHLRVGCHFRVRIGNVDDVHWTAESVRRHLRDASVHALAHFALSVADCHATIGLHVDKRVARKTSHAVPSARPRTHKYFGSRTTHAK